jgi:hypothetical protein
MYARIEILAPDDGPDLTALVSERCNKANVEQIFRLRLEAFDWNAISTSCCASPNRKSPRLCSLYAGA